MLYKLQKRICRTADPSLAASSEPLAHRRSVVSWSLFYRYYFGRCSSELAQLVPLPYSRETNTRYSDRLHGFLVTIPRCCKDVYINSFFPHTARLWNSLPIECFPLTYDLNFVFLTPCLSVAVQPCMEWIPINKKYECSFWANIYEIYGDLRSVRIISL